MIGDLEPVSLYIMSNLWCMERPNVDKIGVVGHHHKPFVNTCSVPIRQPSGIGPHMIQKLRRSRVAISYTFHNILLANHDVCLSCLFISVHPCVGSLWL
jgi:hypothetical protein